ncbi:MAG: DUF1015 domain-containing protein [Candidatus Methylomirabilales bacterium]
MARILPFRGYRYNREKLGVPAAVVSPPYDVIPEEFRRELHLRHPYNVIRLILGEDRAGDDAAENRYLRARRHFQEWEEARILLREAHPAFYVYQQEYPWRRGERRVRTGLIGAVGLEAYSAGVIFPHEQTLPAPKADRLRLMQALPVNLEQIFYFYPGPPEPIRSLLRQITQAPPLCDFGDGGGIRHRLWVLQGSEAIATIITAFRERPLFIADGHHRYETALRFREEMWQTDLQGDPDSAYNFVMATLVSVEDEGLTVLPTHRLITATGVGGSAEILSVLGTHFHREERIMGVGQRGIQKYLQEMEDRGREAHLFGLYTGGDTFCLLTLKDPDMVREVTEQGCCRAFEELDVVILERLVFRRLLRIQDEGMIRFTHEEGVALEEVRSGRSAAAFFLNPTPVAQIMEVAAARERLPPKSTFFYPKLLSGLVFFRVDPGQVLEAPKELS